MTTGTPENLAAALAAFQAEIPHIGKGNLAVVKSDKGSYKYTYADLSDISAKVLPLLAKHGLSFSAKPTLNAEGKFVLEYALRHASGESDVGQYPLNATGTPQQVGSAITYARRYALCAVTGVTPDEDDDGAAASQIPATPPRSQHGDYNAVQKPTGPSRAELDKRAATAVDALLVAATQEAADKTMTRVEGSPAKDVEVSGLLKPDDREALDLTQSASVSLYELAVKVVAYVAKHGRAVRADAKAAA